jgi:hypothetical protein
MFSVESVAAAAGKAKMRPHYVRAFKAEAARGFKLGTRKCHGHVDLRGVEPQQLHDCMAEVIQRRLHAQGFSYVRGNHCVGFANELMGSLRPLLKSKREAFPRKVAFLKGQCCNSRVLKWGAYLEANGYGEMAAQLQAGEDAGRAKREKREKGAGRGKGGRGGGAGVVPTG